MRLSHWPACIGSFALALVAGCSAKTGARATGVAASALQSRSVCASGCDYSLPSEALAEAVDGDTIRVEAGTYIDCLYITKNEITVAGVNGVARITGKVCGQKGIVVTAGRNATLQNLELDGATDGENYAGIRHDAAGSGLTLDNVFCHDNDDGILASSDGDTIVIRNSRFENNGMNAATGYGHNLYISHAASFSFLNSRSTHAKLAGHELKSRAARTTIDSSVLATLDGFDSRLLDASNGGVVTITNSVLVKGAGSDNAELIAFAPEGETDGIEHAFTMTGNRIIDDKGRGGPVVLFYAAPAAIEISGNTIVEPGLVSNAGNPHDNQVFPSRGAAGYPDAPWLPDLPLSSPPTPTVTFTRCASEHDFCAFSGTMRVRYGAGDTWVEQTRTDGVSCSNDVFGDPLYGVYKSCEIAPVAP